MDAAIVKISECLAIQQLSSCTWDELCQERLPDTQGTSECTVVEGRFPHAITPAFLASRVSALAERITPGSYLVLSGDRRYSYPIQQLAPADFRFELETRADRRYALAMERFPAPGVPASPNGRVTASVIVPTHARGKLLYWTLSSLNSQRDAPPFEVIVVENGSTETTSLEKTFPAFRFVRLDAAGVCAARNAGAAAAKGEILIYLDDDIVPTSRFVASHVLAHNGSAHVVLGRVSFVVPTEVDVWGVRWQAEIAEQNHRVLVSNPGPCSWNEFATGNFSLPRWLMEKVGGFDTQFDPYAGEEMDMAFRLAANGASFEYLTAAWGKHTSADSEARFYDKARLTGRGMALLLRTHGLDVIPVQKHPATVIFRRAFRHAPRALAAGLRCFDAAVRTLNLPFDNVRFFAHRMKQRYAFWSGVREVLSWDELAHLQRKRAGGGQGLVKT